MFRIQPVLMVQEDGYRTTSLSANACAFFRGLLAGSLAPAAKR